MTAPLARTPYHTALVVDSLETAMADEGVARALTWTLVEPMELVLGTPEGLLPVRVRIVYATTPAGPADDYLELIETVPGSVWTPTADGAPHHVGVWSDDFLADHRALIDAGRAPVAWATGPEGQPAHFAYHESQDGRLVEIVDSRTRPAFERWLAGGRYR